MEPKMGNESLQTDQRGSESCTVYTRLHISGVRGTVFHRALVGDTHMQQGNNDAAGDKELEHDEVPRVTIRQRLYASHRGAEISTHNGSLHSMRAVVHAPL